MTDQVEKHYRIGNSAISVGRFTYGHENLAIHEWGEGANLRIGSFCSLASCIQIFLGGNHRADWITTYPFGHIYAEQLGGTEIFGHPSTKGDITIGNDVWIGYGSTIMSGVSIGSGSIIAANSTVTKDISPYEITGGNPAKRIRSRFPQKTIELLLQLQWWNLPQETIKEIAPILSRQPVDNEIANLILKYCQKK